MKYAIPAYRIFPLGDSAVVVDFGNLVDEAVNNAVLALYDHLKNDPSGTIYEMVPAYSSLTIYFDPLRVQRKMSSGTAMSYMTGLLAERCSENIRPFTAASRKVVIPVCYEIPYAPDLLSIAQATKLSVDAIISLHSSRSYTVYMMGFLPGFAYMGEVDDRIAMPRKTLPTTVVSGSVGIAGKQTGVYPFTSPGGWQIIGRTPLKLFDPEIKEAVLLQAGDSVSFQPITGNEFENY